MCGIIGFVGNDPKRLKQATDSIKHRGPDAEGQWSDGVVSLGHRRLSIIDLDQRSNQPLHYKHLHITFNGEIYNFQELKGELKGHEFRTNSDTELILHAYQQWGSDCVKRFDGMWAFAIYDDRKREIFLSRDRFGIKPLYYTTKGDFTFASEVKAIRVIHPNQDVSLEAVNHFFYQKYIGKGNSIFRGIKKLEPGHNLTYYLDNNAIELVKYYMLSHESSPQIPSIDELRFKLDAAIQCRLLADVEVGSFLSGGLDSSLISALIKKKKDTLRTFSIGFKQQSFSELAYSDLVARHIQSEHETEVLDITDDFIHQSMLFLDEPFGDSSYLPTRLLSQMTAKYVKVALSGDGADEIFGGYDTYYANYLTRFYPSKLHAPLQKLVNLLPEANRKVSMVFKAKRFLRTYSSDPLERHLDWMATYTDDAREELLGANYIAKSELGFLMKPNARLQDIQLDDLQNYMVEDILKKVDMASMTNGLEVRVPFLSPDIVSLGLNLPDTLKLNMLDRKIFLKKLGYEYLPKEILNRKKKGFTSPVRHWFQKSDLLKEFTLSEQYYKHQLIDFKHIQNLANLNLRQQDTSRELWLVFCFNFWAYYHWK